MGAELMVLIDWAHEDVELLGIRHLAEEITEPDQEVLLPRCDRTAQSFTLEDAHICCRRRTGYVARERASWERFIHSRHGDAARA